MSRLLLGFSGSGQRGEDSVRWFRDWQFHLDEMGTEFNFDPETPKPTFPSPFGVAWPVDDRFDKKLLRLMNSYDRTCILGYSSGAFFATGFALRNPGRVHALCAYAGAIMARDAWRPNGGLEHTTRHLYVHGDADQAVKAAGGFVPVGTDLLRGEGYLGPRQSVQLVAGSGAAQDVLRMDLIDAREDGLGDWVKPGVDTTAEQFGVHELWTIDGGTHVDYVGRGCTRKIMEWLWGND